MKYTRNIIIASGMVQAILIAQLFIPALPEALLRFEYISNGENKKSSSLNIRPIIPSIFYGSNKSIILKINSVYNGNKPNLENNGIFYAGKGFGALTSINFSYLNNNLIFTAEPFYLINQNKDIVNSNRATEKSDSPDMFNVLNDSRYSNTSPFIKYGIKEMQIYLHHKYFGFGLSNANMWWGPGIHSSLTMTNNTAGFPHFMVGTLKEKRYKNFGLNIRYIFSKLNRVEGQPYFTALTSNIKFYTNPNITIGIIRNYLSGGSATDRNFNIWDASMIIFEELFLDTKVKNYPEDWEPHDPWDQILAGFLSIDYPKSKLKLFLELAFNDHRQNWSDLRAQPDHSMAYILGLRKYGFFNLDQLMAGFEYVNLKRTYSYKFRNTGNYYDVRHYSYSTYDNRRWTAHSGSDSDDFLIFLGYRTPKWLIMPSFNYERHGIYYSNPPEIKIEFRFNIFYIYRDYVFDIYYENESVINSGFITKKLQHTNIIKLGIERDIAGIIGNFNK